MHYKIITMSEEQKKCCAGCKDPKSKPLNEFYKNKSNLDGYSNYCKVCTKLNAKKYYQKKLIKKANKETIIRKRSSDNQIKKIVKTEHSNIESSLKLAMIERHIATALNLMQEFKQETELFGLGKIETKATLQTSE